MGDTGAPGGRGLLLCALLLLCGPLLRASAQTECLNAIAAAPGFSEFLAVLQAAGLIQGLADAIGSEGSVTIFAPTNAALLALPAATRTALLTPQNRAALQALLLSHISTAEVGVADFVSNPRLTTLSGIPVTLQTSPPRIDGLPIASPAAVAKSECIVHGVSGVVVPALPSFTPTFLALGLTPTTISPPSDPLVVSPLAAPLVPAPAPVVLAPAPAPLRPAPAPAPVPVPAPARAPVAAPVPAPAPRVVVAPCSALLTAGRAEPQFRQLVSVLNVTGVEQIVRNAMGPVTVFGPVDSAFSSLPAPILSHLSNPANLPDLVTLLTYHVANGFYNSTQLLALAGSNILSVLNASPIAVQRNGSTVLVGTPGSPPSTVLLPNRGNVPGLCVLHGISQVLLPPGFLPDQLAPTPAVTVPLLLPTLPESNSSATTTNSPPANLTVVVGAASQSVPARVLLCTLSLLAAAALV